MQNFEYANPKSVKEATAFLGSNWGDAAVLAGGTDLISLMKDYVETPKRVVSLRGIKALGGIGKSGGGVRIGATATIEDVMSNALIRSEYPALAAAARGITSPQIRNMGTAGGDLLQRPRCWYYRNGFGLLASQNGKSLVPEGENQYHAIFGSGPAYFVSASSLGPALIALGATVKLVSASGTRDLPIAELFVAPADGNARETAIKPNEILTEINVPSARGVKNSTYEVRERDAVDWPLATASVALRMKGNAIESGVVVLGHVAPTPYVAADAGKMLAGKTISESTAAEIGKAAVAGAKPLSGNAYKVTLAQVAVKRALMAATGAKA
jgi:xanthine dehydrogenase YagS FAD-binding subunit